VTAAPPEHHHRAAPRPDQRPDARRESAADSPRRIIITIDGPAGTGKSSVARELAAELGLEFLDTGAMYRAAAAIVIDRGIDVADEQAVAKSVRSASIHFDWQDDPPTLYAMGEPLTDRLREADVGRLVSPVSQLPAVRSVLVEKQRRIGEAHPRLVSEGRDQGSVVFPDAQVKFYLDASVEVRTARRVDQLRAKGRDADEQLVRDEIIDRDERDSTRTVGPLVCPPDARRVITDDMTRQEVVAHLASAVREAVPESHLEEAARIA
jgi:cytidylate kinase